MVKNTVVHLASESRHLLLEARSELLDGRGVCNYSREAIPVLDVSGKEGVFVDLVIGRRLVKSLLTASASVV